MGKDAIPAKESTRDNGAQGDLRQRLSAAASHGTPAERAIAAFILSNLHALPFETAATVAHRDNGMRSGNRNSMAVHDSTPIRQDDGPIAARPAQP